MATQALTGLERARGALAMQGRSRGLAVLSGGLAWGSGGEDGQGGREPVSPLAWLLLCRHSA